MKRMTESGYEYCDRHLKATELRLGLPWSADEEQPPPPAAAPEKSNYISYNQNKNKRSSPETTDDDDQDLNLSAADDDNSSISDARNNVDAPPPSKTQIVGWPPVRSYRKNSLQLQNSMKCENNGNYVKVSMDGAAYLRKIDLKMYNNYPELQNGIETMFKVKIGKYSEREGYINDGSSLSDYAPTYEDKDGDWMLVGDVPWDMFTSSCMRLRVMKSSEVKGLGGCI